MAVGVTVLPTVKTNSPPDSTSQGAYIKNAFFKVLTIRGSTDRYTVIHRETDKSVHSVHDVFEFVGRRVFSP